MSDTSAQPPWLKPVPTVSGETKPFWDAARRDELMIQRCGDCNQYQWYPRGFCSICWSSNIEWVKSAGRGKVWTFTITRQNRAPGFKEDLPYVVALVELDEGVKMFTNIINCDPETVKIGMAVKLTWVAPSDDLHIPYFEPA